MGTFSNAVIGDNVWSVKRGWGKVTQTEATADKGRCGIYPIGVEFTENKRGIEYYTIDGKCHGEDILPEIFWDKFPITIAPRPKRRVSYEEVLYSNIYPRENALDDARINKYYRHGSTHATQDQARVAGNSKSLGICKITYSFEVEE